MSPRIKVSGTGCCLVDLLFNNIDFSSEHIRPFLSKYRGDGGLTPGHLVFREEFEKYCSSSFDTVLDKITGGRSHDKINIGGPSIVSLINVTQLVDISQCEVRFYGMGGNDELGQYLVSALGKTKVILRNYRLIDQPTPSTVVLSDPLFENGHGERMFINSIGAAWKFGPEELDEDFFNSDLVIFGGTALVPGIHDNLSFLLKKARSKGCRTIVNTVFDFRNEKADPLKKWPLGENDDSYENIDLLITDREEALRLSGEKDTDSAAEFFTRKNVSAFIITDGSKNIRLFSDGRFLSLSPLRELPSSEKVIDELSYSREGDTTGCGDNFAGGVIASTVLQLCSGIIHPDLTEACIWGIVSGGFTCFYVGGTYLEDYEGEKSARIKPYYDAYRKQISDRKG
jgi:sugar/nucleoside kinase (ribokinase family)